MKKARFLFATGIWVAVLPHLGFPYMIKNILFLATGLCLVYVSLVIYKQVKRGRAEEKFDNFIENDVDEVIENYEKID